MGFMDRVKQAAEAAKEASSPATAQMAGDVNRIGKEGVVTPAVLKSMTAQGGEKFGGGTEYVCEVEVQPEGGAPYAATITQQLIPASAEAYEKMVGGSIKVKVDPADPQKMLLWY